MVRFLFTLLALSALSFTSFSQNGYQIKIKIDGFGGKEVYLGYFYGDKQYLKDTASINEEGYFVFEGEEENEGGIYLIVMPPDNSFFQFLVPAGEQHFSLVTKVDNPTQFMKVSGSLENELFYQYFQYLDAKRPLADSLRQEISIAGEYEKKKAAVEEQLLDVNEKVAAYQKTFIEKHPKSLTAALIKANNEFDMPEFEGKDEEVAEKRWRWLQQHYFDNIDLGNPWMLRTPFLFQKIDYYINKLTVQHPDSISAAIDKILDLTRPSEETFKFYLIHFLNTYAKSKIVGYDAIYVHIVLKYYATGQAPWTEKEQLAKIIDNAKKLEPLLIGKIAPNIQMETRDHKKMWLHDFKAPFTVLFFWDPECGHCQRAMPSMLAFQEKFKDKGVEVFAVCTKLATRDSEGNWSMKEVDKCWSFIDDKKMGVWFNTVDPYHRSRYKSVYDIRSTPQIYILDENKKILFNRIGADQLPDVMEHIIELKEKDSNP